MTRNQFILVEEVFAEAQSFYVLVVPITGVLISP